MQGHELGGTEGVDRLVEQSLHVQQEPSSALPSERVCSGEIYLVTNYAISDNFFES